MVNHVGKLICSTWKKRPFPLVEDGDLHFLIFCVLGALVLPKCARLRAMLRMTWLLVGRVRRAALEGNNRADEAADLGRRRRQTPCLARCLGLLITFVIRF